MKRLAKLEPIAAVVEERVAPFLLPSPPRPLAPPLMRLESASVGYGDAEPVLRNLNLRLDIDDRIGLLGVKRRGQEHLRQDGGRRAGLAGRAHAAGAPHPGRLVPPAPDRGAGRGRHAARHHPPGASGGQRDQLPLPAWRAGASASRSRARRSSTCRAGSVPGCC